MEWWEIVGYVLLVYVAVVYAVGAIAVAAVGIALAMKHATLGLMLLVRMTIDSEGVERDRACREAGPRLMLALAENALLRQLVDVAGVAREAWLAEAIKGSAPAIVAKLNPELADEAKEEAEALVVREIGAALERAKENLENARRVVPC